MSIVINITAANFIITIDGIDTLTKDRDDVYVCVSPDDSTIVQVWETSPQETQRNIIFSSIYSDFTSPSGASAAIVCAAINSLFVSDANTSSTGLHFVERLITSSELLTFSTSPITLVTGVANYYISPVYAWLESNYVNGVSTGYTHTTQIEIYNQGASNSLMTDNVFIASTLNRAVAMKPFYVTDTTSTQLISGASLMIGSFGDNPESGNFDIQIHVIYQLVSASF